MARQYFLPLRECAATIAAEVIATGASTGWAAQSGVHEIAEILEPFEIGATGSTSVEWRKIDRKSDLAEALSLIERLPDDWYMREAAGTSESVSHVTHVISATLSQMLRSQILRRHQRTRVGETLPAPPAHTASDAAPELIETARRLHVQGYDVTTMPVLELEEKENALAREIFTKHLRIAQISALESDIENDKARKSIESFAIACLGAAEFFYRGIGVNESDRVRVTKRPPADVENIEKRMEFFLHEFLAGHRGPVGQSDLRKIAKTIVGIVLKLGS